MEFKQLQSFVTVVKYGSFTKAAEQLFVSQPTVSAHVSALEEELRQKLIIRTTKSIELTEKGQEVLEYAIHILEMRERIEGICQKQERPVIYIGASTIPAAYILPEVLAEFILLYPELCFDITQTDSQGVITGLSDGVYDLGFVGMQDDKVACEPFCRDRMVLVTPATEKYLSIQKETGFPVEKLLKEPVILREEGSGSGKYAAVFLESIGYTQENLKIVARINDQESTKRLVAGGLGVSIISEMAARDYVQDGKILQFELPANNHRYLYLVSRKEEEAKPYIRELMDLVHKKYAGK